LHYISRVFRHLGLQNTLQRRPLNENVYSGEVEAVIYEQPAVREATVFGIPDPQWGELVMACVVLKQEKAPPWMI
jgi:non-ribosomal peptide synthetase component E (peptide arylation enzyme)